MSKDNLRSYEVGRPWPWYCWIRDRLHGERARANARLGYLRPPSGTEASVRMAAEILSAIRHRRLDVRLVLSFEEAYPDVVAPRAQGLKKVAVGYGPCDSLSAVSRALARLDPFALIYVNCAGGANLITAERSVWWQALAGGSPVTISGGVREQRAQAAVPPVEDLPQGIIARWQQYRHDPIEARRQGDECRKLFWKERRRAAEVLQEFLQRVFDW